MKKILMIVFILGGIVQLRASDTLTVRQVFNFNVGDTFDYRISYSGYPTSNSGLIQCLTYERLIIDSARISLNSDTIFYLANSVESDFCFARILIENYTDLDSSILYHDSITESYCADSFFNFSSDTIYSHRRNSYEIAKGPSQFLLNYNPCPYFRETQRSYIEGIGLYHSGDHAIYPNPDDPGLPFDDHTEIDLIYYSHGHFSFGTPYYLTGTNEISGSTSFRIYPNPTTDHIHLSISNSGKADYQFIITDLLGKEVFSSPITEPETNMDVNKISAGIYLWRLATDSETIKTGKLIRE